MTAVVYLTGLLELAGFTAALWWFGEVRAEQTTERQHLDEYSTTLTRRDHRLIRDRIDLDRGWSQLARAEKTMRAELEAETVTRFGMPPILHPGDRPILLHLVDNTPHPAPGDEPA